MSGQWKTMIPLSIVVLAIVIGSLTFFHQSDSVVRIGVVQFTANNLTTLEGFKTGLANLGYQEGKNIQYLFNGPVNNREQLVTEVQNILKQSPDLIFVSPTPAARAAKQATAIQKVPIIFAPVNDPIAAKLVTNMQMPGDNITGVRLAPSDGKRLEKLVQLSARIKTVLFVYNPKDKSALSSLQQVNAILPSLKIELIKQEFTRNDNLDNVVKPLLDQVDAIFLPRDGWVMSKVKDFVKYSQQYRLPISTPRLSQVKMGVTMGYGFIGYEMGIQAARLADRVLKGQLPARLPIETAEDYLFVNMKNLNDINISVDNTILRQAKEIIYDNQQ